MILSPSCLETSNEFISLKLNPSKHLTHCSHNQLNLSSQYIYPILFGWNSQRFSIFSNIGGIYSHDGNAEVCLTSVLRQIGHSKILLVFSSDTFVHQSNQNVCPQNNYMGLLVYVSKRYEQMLHKSISSKISRKSTAIFHFCKKLLLHLTLVKKFVQEIPTGRVNFLVWMILQLSHLICGI